MAAAVAQACGRGRHPGKRPRMSAPPAGLCDSCRHQRVVRNTRGSSFSLRRRSADDDRYPRYPRIPVRSCPGHEHERCWDTSDPLYIAYHDEEWGRPVARRARACSSGSCLEGFQSGLSWITILRKRDELPRGVRRLRSRSAVARFGDARRRAAAWPTPASSATARRSRRRSPTPARPLALHEAGETLGRAAVVLRAGRARARPAETLGRRARDDAGVEGARARSSSAAAFASSARRRPTRSCRRRGSSTTTSPAASCAARCRPRSTPSARLAVAADLRQQPPEHPGDLRPGRLLLHLAERLDVREPRGRRLAADRRRRCSRRCRSESAGRARCRPS